MLHETRAHCVLTFADQFTSHVKFPDPLPSPPRPPLAAGALAARFASPTALLPQAHHRPRRPLHRPSVKTSSRQVAARSVARACSRRRVHGAHNDARCRRCESAPDCVAVQYSEAASTGFCTFAAARTVASVSTDAKYVYSRLLHHHRLRRFHNRHPCRHRARHPHSACAAECHPQAPPPPPSPSPPSQPPFSQGQAQRVQYIRKSRPCTVLTAGSVRANDAGPKPIRVLFCVSARCHCRGFTLVPGTQMCHLKAQTCWLRVRSRSSRLLPRRHRPQPRLSTDVSAGCTWHSPAARASCTTYATAPPPQPPPPPPLSVQDRSGLLGRDEQVYEIRSI